MEIRLDAIEDSGRERMSHSGPDLPPRSSGRRGRGSSEGPVANDAAGQAPAGGVPTAATVGGLLAGARAAAGLSIAEVADRTKVRPTVLRAIEADDHDRLPALTYTIGFVKAFARTVGLDPAAAAERYRAESDRGEPVPTIVDMQPLDEQRRPSRALVGWTAAALVVVLTFFWAWGAGWLTPAPPEPPAPAPQAVAPRPAAAAATAPAAPAADAPVTLGARTDVWLRVSDPERRETFFTGTLKPGQPLVLPAGRSFLLDTGRLGAVEVRVGDRLLPPLGGDAERARGLSLRPADLLNRAQGPAPGPAAAPAAASTPAPAG